MSSAAKPTPRRSPRLAAKSRIEPEMTHSEFVKRRQVLDKKLKAAKEQVVAIPKPDSSAYRVSVEDFKKRQLWRNTDSEDFKAHLRIKRAFEASKREYMQKVAAVRPTLTPDEIDVVRMTRKILGM